MKNMKTILIVAIFGMAFFSVLFAGNKSELDLFVLNKNVKKINKGFVFIDGRYIKIPYKLTIDKGWMTINDSHACKLSEWPLTEENPEKPVIPEEAFKKSKSIEEAGEWIAKMSRWISRNIKEKEKKHKLLCNFLQRFQFVKSVKYQRGGRIILTQKNGEIIPMMSLGVSPIITKKQKLERLERRRKSMEERLEKDDSYFFSPKLGERINFSLGKIETAEDLKLMIEVVTSEKSEKDKLNILYRMMLINEDEPELGLALIRNFKPSKELNQKISELIKETGVKPHTLKDIPKELPSVILERQRKAEDEADNLLTEPMLEK